MEQVANSGGHGGSRPLLKGEDARIARLCLTLLGILSTASLIGVATSLYLVSERPLLLIALSPIGRHLILVAPIVDPIAFVVIAVARRMLFYQVCFHLGRALGPSGVVWIEARAKRFGRLVRWLERLFERARHTVIVLLPGPTVSSLAGIAGVPLRVYLPLTLLGLTLRMLVVLGIGERLRGPIELLLALIAEYRVPGTVALIIGIALYQWGRRSRGRI